MLLVFTRLLVYSMGHLALVFVYWHQFEGLSWLLCGGLLISIIMRWTGGVDKLYKRLILDKKSFILDWWPAALILPWAVYVAVVLNDWLWVGGITAVYWASGVEAMIKLSRWKKAQA